MPAAKQHFTEKTAPATAELALALADTLDTHAETVAREAAARGADPANLVVEATTAALAVFMSRCRLPDGRSPVADPDFRDRAGAIIAASLVRQMENAAEDMAAEDMAAEDKAAEDKAADTVAAAIAKAGGRLN